MQVQAVSQATTMRDMLNDREDLTLQISKLQSQLHSLERRIKEQLIKDNCTEFFSISFSKLSRVVYPK